MASAHAWRPGIDRGEGRAVALTSIAHAAWLVVLSGVWWPAAEAQVRNGIDVQSGADTAALPATLERGWSALRAMDCARCHGRDLDGSSGPDLIAAVRDGSRERFDRFVIDGEIARGMPGYRSQALVMRELDSIYAYLRARADGTVAAGRLSTRVPP
ncbi:MAG TPA: cytochrome c [Burkholderiaceae bacterium]|nr:cytochrome c [Burkholderiaceae bacterium]